MRKYLIFLILFAFFFPLVHKIALSIFIAISAEDPFMLVSYYHKHGLLSIKNLIISSIAGITSFFFTNAFFRWESKKRKD